MKKSHYLIPILLLGTLLQSLHGQILKATSNCSNSITVTYNGATNIWGNNMYLKPCNENQGNCCSIIKNWSGHAKDQYGPPTVLTPGFYTLIESGGFVIAGPQSSPTFNNVPHGTYQIRAQVPIADFCQDGVNDIDLYGYEPDANPPGYYHVGSKGHMELRYSNWTIVGPTTQNDFWTAITPDKYASWNAKTDYCPKEEVFLADKSSNYNRYWIAIFENGGLNRWESTYWQDGTVHNNYTGPNFSLSALWCKNHLDWKFEEGVSYTVQFVIENTSCINTPQWNDKYFDFNIVSCLSDNPDDRTVARQQEVKPSFVLAPNPASTFLTVRIPDAAPDQNYKIVLQDAIGKTAMESSLIGQPLDIQEVPNGVYFVSIYEGEQRVFSQKLIVQH